ncbi:hypothetical protein K501DRAFT_246870 [Backusella circina FSU 941]|nr:hypothetical protein K501DRAFT_228489 [Backusella circina FSU 941]KAI8884999.1 hypothetical protein K501DRAFT_246870 [Backusella circina FSU 941]
MNSIILPSDSSVLIASTSGVLSSAITASSSPTQSASKSSGGLSGGAIGAIVAVIVIIVVGASAYLCISKRRKNKASRTRAITKPDPFTMGFGSDGGGFPAQTFTSQPPMQHNPQIQVSSYQQHNQPSIPVALPASPSSPYYSNNTSNTQFHDANNHIIAPSMMPTIIPQSQYQPQLQSQPEIDHHLTNTSIPPRMSPTQAGSLGVFFVVGTYSPTLSDEIDIQLNDQVELLVEYDDGWCQGINLTRGHAKGVFPRHCIENGNNGANGGDVDRLKRVSSMYMG